MNEITARKCFLKQVLIYQPCPRQSCACTSVLIPGMSLFTHGDESLCTWSRDGEQAWLQLFGKTFVKFAEYVGTTLWPWLEGADICRHDLPGAEQIA